MIEGSPTQIPCRTTHPDVEVTLWRGEEEFKTGEDLMFNPTEGFKVLYPNAAYNGQFLCRFNFVVENGTKFLSEEETTMITYRGHYLI